MMKFVVWGAGTRGRRVLSSLKELVVAFIDSDSTKVGTYIFNRPVINFSRYLSEYRDCFIIVSMLSYQDVVMAFKEIKFNRYFLLVEASAEISSFYEKRNWYNYSIEIQKYKKILIYGCTITGIIWYDYLSRNDSLDISLYVPDEKKELADELIRIGYNIVRKSHLYEKEYDKVLWVVPTVTETLSRTPYWIHANDGLMVIKKYFQERSDFINLYDIRETFNKLFLNPLLKRFDNLHQGEQCFIIGNGPSLKMDDLDILYQHNMCSMGVNGIFHAFSKTKWRPTYYLATDAVIYVGRKKELMELGAQTMFLGEPVDKDDAVQSSFDELVSKPNVYSFHWQRIPGVSKDFSCGCYVCGTVIEACLQLAIYMGFKEIYLMGMDFDYQSSLHVNSYFDEHYLDIYKRDAVDSKFIPKNINEFDYENVAYNLLLIRRFSESKGIRIYNATRGGKLEIFERVDFDTLLRAKYFVSEINRKN